MFENRTEQEARAEILKLVSEYCEKYHTKKPYENGDRIPYAGRVYDKGEMTALVDSSLDFWLTAGKYTERFEKEFASFLRVKYCSVVNSGSSANLLAFFALTSPLLGERKIERGDEVITVAAGFPTTVSPIVQYGAVPVFIDIKTETGNADTSLLEGALSKKTKAVMLAHTLGNPFNVKEVLAFCKKHHLWLIEDNCDSLGTTYTLDGVTKYTGTFGDIGTSSFYPPHHMTMGEGGAVYTDNPLLHKIIRSMRDWGRDCVCPPGCDNFCGQRFENQYGTLPRGYDHKYVYSHFGFNLKPTDMQCAIGCEQLKKMPFFIKRRKENFKALYDGLSVLSEKLTLPVAEENSDPSWFGFLITCKEDTDRNALVRKLEEEKIQTRMLFAGNLLRHPCSIALPEGSYRVASSLANTDRAMNDSFWLGVYPGMTGNVSAFVTEAVIKAVS